MNVNPNDLFQMIGQQQVEITLLKQALLQANTAIKDAAAKWADAEKPLNGDGHREVSRAGLPS